MKFKPDEDMLDISCYTDDYDYLGVITFSPCDGDVMFFPIDTFVYSRHDLLSISDNIAKLRRMYEE